MTRRIPFPFLPVPVAAWAPGGVDLGVTDRVVLGVLVARTVAGEDWVRISREELAVEAGASLPTVKRAITRLLAAGLVERRSGGGRAQLSAYRLTLPDGSGGPRRKRGLSEPVSSEKRVPTDPVSPSDTGSFTGSERAVNGVCVTHSLEEREGAAKNGVSLSARSAGSGEPRTSENGETETGADRYPLHDREWLLRERTGAESRCLPKHVLRAINQARAAQPAAERDALGYVRPEGA